MESTGESLRSNGKKCITVFFQFPEFLLSNSKCIQSYYSKIYLVLFCAYFIHRAFFPSRVDDMLWKDTWLSRTNRIPTSDSMPPIRQFHAAASPPVQRIDSAFTGVSISSEMKISEIKSTFRPNKSSGYCINGIIVFIPPA